MGNEGIELQIVKTIEASRVFKNRVLETGVGALEQVSPRARTGVEAIPPLATTGSIAAADVHREPARRRESISPATSYGRTLQLAYIISSLCLVLIWALLIEASAASMWGNIASANASCLNSVRTFLAVGITVEAIVNFCVGSRKPRKDDFEKIKDLTSEIMQHQVHYQEKM
ncbi:hypothetical protein Fmac_023388 [Flemingia macrophylla]|uniref:Uncharacterized protein n=1 Tax=Flemingia macrophylla TaxID=520843 RepID=A0ABD1LLF1_9FABA